MSITEGAFLEASRSKLVTTFDAVSEALAEYRDLPSITVLRPTTAACIRVDLIYAKLVAAFDEEPNCGIVEVLQHNSRYFKIADGVLLWFKKVDWFRQPSNARTPHNLRILSGQQDEMFPRSEIVVVGYLLHPETSELLRLSFAPPCRKRPDWYFDIMRPSNVRPMYPTSGAIELAANNRQRQSRLMLIRGDTQQAL
jgi:hypothetical protein